MVNIQFLIPKNARRGLQKEAGRWTSRVRTSGTARLPAAVRPGAWLQPHFRNRVLMNAILPPPTPSRTSEIIMNVTPPPPRTLPFRILQSRSRRVTPQVTGGCGIWSGSAHRRTQHGCFPVLQTFKLTAANRLYTRARQTGAAQFRCAARLPGGPFAQRYPDPITFVDICL